MWLPGFILNILGLLLGISLVFNPFAAFLSVMRLVGIGLVVNGISRLFTDVLFAREMEKISPQKYSEDSSKVIDVDFTDV